MLKCNKNILNLFSENNNNKPRTVVICGSNAACLYLVLLYLPLFCGKIIFKVSFLTIIISKGNEMETWGAHFP